jgi:hypothetical protein
MCVLHSHNVKLQFLQAETSGHYQETHLVAGIKKDTGAYLGMCFQIVWLGGEVPDELRILPMFNHR